MSNNSNPTMRPSLNLYFIAILVSLGTNFPRGYYSLVYTVSQDVFERWVNGSSTFEDASTPTFLWSSVIAGTRLTKIVGILLGAWISDRWGRVPCNKVMFPVTLASLILQFVARYTVSSPLLFLGILLTGIYNGMILVVSNMFLMEISYASKIRGCLSSIAGMMASLGDVVGALLALEEVLGTDQYWHILVAIPGPLILLGFAAVFFAKETPTFLCWRGDSEEKIKESIKFYYADATESEIKQTIDEGNKLLPDKTKKSVTLCQIWRQSADRKAFLLVLLVRSILSFSGIAFIYSYAAKIMNVYISLHETKWGKWSTLGFCCVAIGARSLSMYLVDKWGRRPLTLWGFLLMVVVHFVMCLLWLLRTSITSINVGYASVAAIGVWWIGFTATNVSTNALSVEMFSQEARAKGRAMTLLYSLALNGLFTFLFLPVFTNSPIGGYIFGIFGAITTPLLILCWIYCPETRKANLLKGMKPKSVKNNKLTAV